MQRLNNKRIIVGISGGIAAYKTCELVRRLTEHGATVRVVMTEAAQAFVTPLTFQALSTRPVLTELLDTQAEAAMGHIELAKWADAVLVAPASADFIARLSSGMADDLLTTLCLATQSPIALAPAMNQAMWSNSLTQENCSRLKGHHIQLWGPANGPQACGDIGPGRMLEVEQLLDHVCALLVPEKSSRHIVITAGPTREAIDPVRYISHHSSGKMGFALAAAAARSGAKTTLIAGPVNLTTPPGVHRVNVVSAEQMFTSTLAHSDPCDIFIATAAVADYRPAQAARQKIKKSRSDMTLSLLRNKDIISAVADQANKPFMVGFAAETQQLEHHARDKLVRKNLDMIIANNVADQSIGFNSDHNAVTVFWSQGNQQFERMTKTRLAEQLFSLVMDLFQHTKNHS